MLLGFWLSRGELRMWSVHGHAAESAKHTDLKDEFDRRKQDANGVPSAFQTLHARAVDAEAANAKLRADNEQLRDRAKVYAQVIHELVVERDRRNESAANTIRVLDSSRARREPDVIDHPRPR